MEIVQVLPEQKSVLPKNSPHRRRKGLRCPRSYYLRGAPDRANRCHAPQGRGPCCTAAVHGVFPRHRYRRDRSLCPAFNGQRRDEKRSERRRRGQKTQIHESPLMTPKSSNTENIFCKARAALFILSLIVKLSTVYLYFRQQQL